MKKLIILLALLSIFLLPGCLITEGLYSGSIPIDEFPYRIEIYEGNEYIGAFIVRDYKEIAGGISFKGYYGPDRRIRYLGFFYFERETIFTGCRFDIIERTR